VTTPKTEFRPNPERAIHLHGEINHALVHRLTPQILTLQSQSREPITAYIDSNGGSPQLMIALLRLIKAPTQDYGEPCELITVVTRLAASAAADFLSTGDYALAYPGSRILFHGVRATDDKPLTAERMSLLAQYLRLSNESSARQLTSEVEFRFIFRFVSSMPQFDAVRAEQGDDDMTDLDCFLKIISGNLSYSAKEVLKTAIQRYKRYDALVNYVNKKTRSLPASKTPLEREGAQIRAIVDFEVKNNKRLPHWSFQGAGINRLVDDFLLFREHQAMAGSDRFKWFCERICPLLVVDDVMDEIERLAEPARTERILQEIGPPLEPIWSFFVALCHSLQHGENELTAVDAYWLGLIDEVYGDEDLHGIRTVLENMPPETEEEDAEEEATNDAAAEAAGAEAAGAEAGTAED
jgi:hypothetical protein